MSKHTPGPWAISTIHQDGYFGNRGESSVICETHRICAVDCITEYKRGTGYETQCGERDANARLIAAAPDMLELAQMVAENCTIETPVEWVNAANAILNKARGVTQ